MDDFYDQLAREARELQDAAGVQSYGAANESADAAAKIDAASRESGVAPAVIQLNPPEVISQLNAERNAALVRDDPILQQYINQSPINAQLSNDDYKKMSSFGNLWSAIGTGIGKGYLSQQRGRAGSEAQIQRGLDLPEDPALARAKSIEDQIRALPDYEGFPGFVQDVFGGVETIAEILAPAAVGVAAGPGGAAVGLAAGGVEAARAAAGNWYLDNRNTVDDAGRPVTEGQLAVGALTVFAANSVMNMFGIKFVPGVQSLVREAVTQVVKDPTAASVIARAGLRLGQAGLAGGAWGVAGAMVDKVAQIVDLGQLSTLTDPAKRSEALMEIGHAGLVGAALFGGLHVPAFGKSVFYDALRVNQHKERADAFQEAYKEGQGTKTFERSPGTIADFAESVAPGAKVGIPVSAVRALYGDKEMGPGDGLLGDVIPDLQVQVDKAEGLGEGDIEITASQYVGKVPPELNKILQPDLRYADEDVTDTEIEEVKDGKKLDTEIVAAAQDNAAKALEDYTTMQAADETKLAEVQTQIDAETDPTKKEALRTEWTFLSQESEARLTQQSQVVLAAQNEAARHKARTADVGPKPRELPPKEDEVPPAVVGEPAPDFVLPEVEVTAEREVAPEVKPAPEVAPAREGAAGPLPPLSTEGVAREATVVKEEVNKVRRELYLDPILEDPNLGLNVTEFERYSRAVQKMHEAENEAALSQAERLQKRLLTPTWKAAEAAEREGATAEVDNAPDMKAYKAITEGDKNTKLSLDRDAVNQILNDEKGADSLPKGTVKKGGIDPAEVAEVLGFRTGQGLVRALQLLNSGKGEGRTIADLREQRIDQITRTRMEAKHGVFEDVVRREAEKLVLAKTQHDVLIEELKILRDRSGDETPLSEQQLVNKAKQGFGDMEAKTGAKFGKFWGVLNRTGARVQRALLTKKYDKAFIWKQKQFLAHVAAQESHAFRQQYLKAGRQWKAYAAKKALPSMAQSALDQIHLTLELLGIKTKRTATDMQDAFAARGRFLDSAKLLRMEPPELPFRPGMTLDNMTVDEFRAVDDYVNWLDQVGRDMEKVIVEGKAIEMEKMRTEVTTSLDKMQNVDKSKTIKGTFLKVARTVDATLVKVEKLMQQWDGMARNGPFGKFVTNVIQGAKYAEKALERKAIEKYQAFEGDPEWQKGLRHEIEQNTFRDPLTGEALTMTRKGMLSVAINLGNASNKQRLLDGFGVGEPEVTAFLKDNMTPADWKWVNGMLDFFKWLRPQERAMEKRVNGYSSKDITATPIVIDGVQVSEGGYFPLMYDKQLGSGSTIAEERGLLSLAPGMKPATARGYTKTRVAETPGPLLLEGMINQLPFRINEAIHDITHREAVKEVSKVLLDKTVRDKILQKAGTEYADRLIPWLDYVASGVKVATDGAGFANWLAKHGRANATSAMIGFNLNSILTPNFAKLMGPDGAKIIGQMFSSPEEFRKQVEFAKANSQELQNTMENLDVNARDALVRTLGERPSIAHEATRFAFALLGKVENTMRVGSWISEYNRATELGESHATAVKNADARVRLEHGATGSADIAAVFRTNEVTRAALTMFYTYFNTIYNNQRDIFTYGRRYAQDVAIGDSAGAKRDFAQVLANSWFWVVFPAAFGYLVYGNPKKDDGPMTRAGKALGAQVLGTIPIAREIGAAVMNNYDYRVSPLASVIQTGIGTATDIKRVIAGDRKHEPSDKWLRHSLETVGYLTGLPTGQIGKSAQYLWDLHENKQKGREFWETARGLRTGTSAEAK